MSTPSKPHNFDQVISRASTNSSKWNKFAADVLPMWVADMDFAAPPFILDALKSRIDHPILGYTDHPASLNEAFQGWLDYHFGWKIHDAWQVWLPGVVPALNLACQTLEASSEIIIPTPVYHPFLALAKNASLKEVRVPMRQVDGHWSIDFDTLQASVTPRSRMILICNPQNPTGRCYNEAELHELASFVINNNLILVSDEIHCNIILGTHGQHHSIQHHPIAALVPELLERTISLYSASKVYNIPGVSSAVAVIADSALRQRFINARKGLIPGIGPLGFVAAECAFRDRSNWIPELTQYLRGNLEYLREQLGNRLTPLEGTYLAWINVADQQLENAEQHFAHHGLGISPGAQFGEASHIRLNFGCPRSTLAEGLRRFKLALQE